ncbi:MAG TPA: HIT family protein [Longimicrobium sp.]|nr:HIT family protein [Longimicrobium sp.]
MRGGPAPLTLVSLDCSLCWNYNLLMGTCSFCQIIKGVEPAHRIWESEDFLAFLTIRPCNAGHTLLIPKTHVDYVFDVEEPLYSNIFRAAKQLSEPIKQATDAKRIGVAIEGLSVPHVHLHLVPLYDIAELDPHRHIEQTQQELAEMAGRIRREIPSTGTEAAI